MGNATGIDLQVSCRAPRRATALGGRLASALAIAALLVSGGCGGPGTSQPDPAAASDDQDQPEIPQMAAGDTRRQQAENDLVMRQEAACDRVGGLLFHCSVEDARKTMTAEEFAQLRPDELQPRFMEEFMAECLDSKMSLRQIKVYETCADNPACEDFIPCLDDAQRQ